MMEFGEIRSRIHNGEEIFWEDLKHLFDRDNYRSEVVPYLASFPEYWDSYPLKKMSSMEELFRCIEIAPFPIYDLRLSEGEPLDFSNDGFRYVKSLDVSGNEIGDERGRILNESPYLKNCKIYARGE